MPKPKFTQEQIAYTPKQAEGGTAVQGAGYVPHIRRIGEEKLDDRQEKTHPARRWVGCVFWPAASSFSSPMRRGLYWGDVGHRPCPRHDGFGGRIVVAFVQTQVLRGGLGRQGARDDAGLKRCLQQFAVGGVGPADASSEGAAVPFDQQALLDARLGAVSRVGADALLLCPLFPTPLPGTPRALLKQPSADCHCQSTPCRSSHLVSRMAHRMSKMAFCSQRVKARYTLLLSPNSWGRWFHWPPTKASAGPHPKDDAVEGQALIAAPASGRCGRVVDSQHLLDQLPERVGHVPERRQRLGLVGPRHSRRVQWHHAAIIGSRTKAF